MKIFVCVLSLFILGASLPRPLRGQAIDLVELKKKEEERRKKLAKSKYILTDGNLAKVSADVGAKGSSFIQIEVIPSGSDEGETRTEAVAATAAAAETQASAAENPEITTGGETKSAEEWKGQKTDIENRIAQYRDEINREQSNLNKLWTDFYLQDIPSMKEQLRIQIDAMNSKIENLKTMLDQAQRELQQFLDKARKAGVPPGWLR